MCLGVPTRIVDIEEEGKIAIADAMGVRMRISLELLPDEVKVGDYVIVHVGYAISKLDEREAEESLRMIQEITSGDLSSAGT